VSDAALQHIAEHCSSLRQLAITGGHIAHSVHSAVPPVGARMAVGRRMPTPPIYQIKMPAFLLQARGV
jgi:hypothetical protein